MRWMVHVILGSIIAFGVYHFAHEFFYSKHSPTTVATAAFPQNVTSSMISTVEQHMHHLLPGGAPPPGDYHGGIWYSPATNLEQIDVNEIENNTSGHLDIAMYAFTDIRIARAVVDVANRGVQVRIYRDNEQWREEQHRDRYVLSLLEGNPNIHIRVKGSSTLMHLKAYCDGTTLREGSANWSPSGEKRQDNTLTLTTDRSAVNQFEQEFNHIWNRPRNIVIQ